MRPSLKRSLIAIVASIGLAGIGATPALAASGGSSASQCGATHGAFADENGNFGWLGALGGTPGYHGAVGQQPGATGSNNSSVDCSPN